MVELTKEQIALEKKLKRLDKNLKIRWSEGGVVSQIDGILSK